MTRALLLANKALSINAVPIASILVYNNFELANSINSCYSYKLCHAENNLIFKSSFYFSKSFFENSIIYLTLEPCCVCYDIINYYRIKRVIFAVNCIGAKAYYCHENNLDLTFKVKSLNLIKSFFIKNRY